LSSFFASPYGNRLLADLGADVIKIEPPGGDPQRSLPDPAENVNAGKRSIVIDLKNEAARPVIERLLSWADVVGHNMRPGAVERLGLGEDDVRSTNPSVIYTYGPGYGSTGPKSGLQSFAPLHSGLVGLMHLAAGEGNEPVVPFGNEDYYTGLLSAIGTLLALVHRVRTGVAQYVEVPQLLATAFVVSEFFRADGVLDTTLGHLDSDQTGWSPYVRLYRCSDGWLCVCALHDDARRALRAVAEVEPDAGDVDLASRLAATMSARPAEHWRTELRARGIPCELARTTPWLTEHLNDPDSLRRGESVEIDTDAHGRVRVIGNLFRLHGSLLRGPHVRAPLAGEHTQEILRELGFDDSEQLSRRTPDDERLD
jgi:crotonobetainyl-CoA:carnitine CoA-transferase CaiB-like acyl-CoA transferase